MAVLKCDACNCSYNQEKCCCKGDIMVGGQQAEKPGETCCESFRQAAGGRMTSALAHPSQTISIDCEAVKCVHNTNYKCYADKVSISGSSACDCRQTACATFRER